MDVSNILKNGLFQKISTPPPPPWMALENPGFLLGFFQEGEAKNFLRGTPSKFFEANDSGGGGKFFLKKMKV